MVKKGMSGTVEKEKGSVLLMILVLISVFFILLGGLLPMMITEVRASSDNTNYIIAKYAADAGAKLALQRAQSLINNTTYPPAQSFNNLKISNTSSATISASYTPLDARNNPVRPGVRPSRIWIQARGVYQGTRAQAAAYIFLDDTSPVIGNSGSDPGSTLLDMMNTATYSHRGGNPKGSVADECRWKLDPISQCANPIAFSLVMFNDQSGQDLNISYRASARISGNVNPGNLGAWGGGYSILYGMTGNADIMNAYSLQYDPGAQYDNTTGYYAKYGTLVIKKVICSSKNRFDRFDDTPDPDPGKHEKNEDGAPWGNEYYYAHPFENARKGEVLRIPLAASDATPANGGTSLQTIMNQYHHDNSFDIYAPHTFTIITENDARGNKWHRIKCDDNPTPVLQFYDHTDPRNPRSTVGQYKVSDFSKTHTGLRVWTPNVMVNFMNLSRNEDIRKSIVWVK